MLIPLFYTIFLTFVIFTAILVSSFQGESFLSSWLLHVSKDEPEKHNREQDATCTQRSQKNPLLETLFCLWISCFSVEQEQSTPCRLPKGISLKFPDGNLD